MEHVSYMYTYLCNHLTLKLNWNLSSSNDANLSKGEYLASFGDRVSLRSRIATADSASE